MTEVDQLKNQITLLTAKLKAEQAKSQKLGRVVDDLRKQIATIHAALNGA